MAGKSGVFTKLPSYVLGRNAREHGQLMRASIAEFIGTFALVFIGTATAVLAGSGLLGGATGPLAVAFAFGFTLLVLVYAIGPISGAHVNPAVTVAMYAARKISGKHATHYILAQLIGAFVASLVLLGVMNGFPSYSIQDHGLGANVVPQYMFDSSMLLLEVVLTALFVFVIFSTTSAQAAAGASGLAIGGFLFVAHLIGAPIGGSSLNPARSIAPALVTSGAALSSLWVFIAGPIVGALIGVFLYRHASGHS